jgi:signal transduction histidine kinase
MAQWNHKDRTLHTKLVYYGPALGGKTTNLKALHRLTDPDARERLVAINTADDRTLFFDLLPFELGSLLGYKVAIKLYTVPGQVRYDATRRIVLAGADAVVFVADSVPDREQDNRQSWDNLRLNMRANRLDPAAVPILVQLNKRDLGGAAPAAAMERWFGLPEGAGHLAAATNGDGVLETLIAASRAMVERLVAFAEPQTRRSFDTGELSDQLLRAFAPHVARRAAHGNRSGAPGAAPEPVVATSQDVFESAVASSLDLGAQLADAHGRASRLGREADALRRLSDAVRETGTDFDRASVVRAALASATDVLGASSAALVGVDAERRPRIEAFHGRSFAPILGGPAGTALVVRLAVRDVPTVVDDLAQELSAPERSAAEGLRGAVAVPVEPRGVSTLLLAMPAPDGAIGPDDVRFLAMLAGHLATGLDKVKVHAELAAERNRLEETVRARTRALRKAYEDLRSADAMKDRFLSNVSHEMRTPLTAIIGAASYLRDYDGERADRVEMAGTVLAAAHALERRVDALLRVARLETADASTLRATEPAEVLAEALRLAGEPQGVSVRIDPRVEPFPADFERLGRAVANLVDNARKFGPAGGTIEVGVVPCALSRPGGTVRGVAIAVLDRGPGLPEGDVERAFKPFEQGGDIMTGKPQGVGLGLYEARAISRHHGGTLVYLPRSGGGSEFRISLPGEDAGRLRAPERQRA